MGKVLNKCGYKKMAKKKIKKLTRASFLASGKNVMVEGKQYLFLDTQQRLC